MVFGIFKTAAKAAVSAGFQKAKAEYGQNLDFLEAVCAVAALIAGADGKIEDGERKAAIKVISEHKELSDIYDRATIEKTIDTMLSQAETTTGKLRLNRELDDLKSKPNAKQMAQDVFAVAIDVALADGDIGDKEKEALKRIAGRIGVNEADFDL